MWSGNGKQVTINPFNICQISSTRYTYILCTILRAFMRLKLMRNGVSDSIWYGMSLCHGHGIEEAILQICARIKIQDLNDKFSCFPLSWIDDLTSWHCSSFYFLLVILNGWNADRALITSYTLKHVHNRFYIPAINHV